MGSLFLTLILLSGVDHIFQIEELNNEFSYRFATLTEGVGKYDTMFCFVYPECGEEFEVRLCLVEDNKTLGCISSPEIVTPVTYMYSIDESTDYCFLFIARAPWDKDVINQINVWKNDTLIMRVQR